MKSLTRLVKRHKSDLLHIVAAVAVAAIGCFSNWGGGPIIPDDAVPSSPVAVVTGIPAVNVVEAGPVVEALEQIADEGSGNASLYAPLSAIVVALLAVAITIYIFLYEGFRELKQNKEYLVKILDMIRIFYGKFLIFLAALSLVSVALGIALANDGYSLLFHRVYVVGSFASISSLLFFVASLIRHEKRIYGKAIALLKKAGRGFIGNGNQAGGSSYDDVMSYFKIMNDLRTICGAIIDQNIRSIGNLPGGNMLAAALIYRNTGKQPQPEAPFDESRNSHHGAKGCAERDGHGKITELLKSVERSADVLSLKERLSIVEELDSHNVGEIKKQLEPRLAIGNGSRQRREPGAESDGGEDEFGDGDGEAEKRKCAEKIAEEYQKLSDVYDYAVTAMEFRDKKAVKDGDKEGFFVPLKSAEKLERRIAKRYMSNGTFEDVCLSNVVFKKPNFNNTSFKASMFDWVHFCSAKLDGASFSGCLLQNIAIDDKDDDGKKKTYQNVNFSNAMFANAWIHGLGFANSTFRQTNFSRQRIYSDVGFVNSNLQLSNFNGCMLINVDLHGSDATEANMFGVKLTNARMANIRLSKAKVIHAELTDCDILDSYCDDASFKLSKISGVKFSRSLLTRADFSQASISGGTWYDHCLCKEALFLNVSVTGSDGGDGRVSFKHAQLQKAMFAGGKYERCDFTGALFTGATISKGTVFHDCVFEKAIFNDADVHAEFNSCDFTEAMFDRADVAAAFNGCKFSIGKAAIKVAHPHVRFDELCSFESPPAPYARRRCRMRTAGHRMRAGR